MRDQGNWVDGARGSPWGHMWKSYHINARALAQKIIRSGVFCPSIALDSQGHVRRCDSSQRHASIPHQPPHEMVSMLFPIPFYQ
ncbi:hypothetical protein LIER_36610 [Lithospermum erythrorhizon]|uniref:Uncharacterized protein n=1 Tax=Lithospermum erythrorhizon TaxID=34254 RepID=A0AAV3PAC5_LITER